MFCPSKIKNYIITRLDSNFVNAPCKRVTSVLQKRKHHYINALPFSRALLRIITIIMLNSHGDPIRNLFYISQLNKQNRWNILPFLLCVLILMESQKKYGFSVANRNSTTKANSFEFALSGIKDVQLFQNIHNNCNTLCQVPVILHL